MKHTFPYSSLVTRVNQATHNRESLNTSCSYVGVKLYYACVHPSFLPNENIRDLTQQDGWTQDGRMKKNCRARLCIPIVTRHFFNVLQFWVFQSSCCIRSLLIWLRLIWVRFGRQYACVSRWQMQSYVVVKSKWSTWLGGSGKYPSHELLIIHEIGRQKEKKWNKARRIKQWKEYISYFIQYFERHRLNLSWS